MPPQTISLDDVDAPAQSGTISLDDVDTPTASAQPLHVPTGLEAEGPGSPGYQPKRPILTEPIPFSAPTRPMTPKELGDREFQDLATGNARITQAAPIDPNSAYPGQFRQRTPTGEARAESGMRVAPPTGRPHDPQLDQPIQYDAKTGMPYREPLVPEAEATPILDAWRGVPRLLNWPPSTYRRQWNQWEMEM